MLKTRVITAVIGVAILGIAIFLGNPVYGLMLTLLAILGWNEYFRMFKRMKVSIAALWGAGTLLAVMGVMAFSMYSIGILLLTLSVMGLIVYYTLKENALTYQSLCYSLFGFFYVSLGFASLLIIRDPLFYNNSALQVSPADYGLIFTGLLLLCIWTSDTAAYFVGNKWGARRVVPSISPNKTLEGFLGGFVGTFLMGLIYAFLVGIPFYVGACAGVLIGIAAPLGDLFESKLKRLVHIKDSGKILPGHGGILDRFDSLLFAAPILLAYLTLFK